MDGEGTGPGGEGGRGTAGGLPLCALTLHCCAGVGPVGVGGLVRGVGEGLVELHVAAVGGGAAEGAGSCFDADVCAAVGTHCKILKVGCDRGGRGPCLPLIVL